VIQIERARNDLWVVRRPESAVTQGFPTARAAVEFACGEIRRSDAPSWIQLWIGEMDFGGYFDPADPRPVFGSCQ